MAKRIPGRVILKHDIEENWNKATGFSPEKNEFIFYDPDAKHSYYRLKVGDGITSVIDLGFAMWDSADIANGAAYAKNYTNDGTIAAGIENASNQASQAVDMVDKVINGKTPVGVAEKANSVDWANVTGDKPTQPKFEYSNGILTITT